MHLSGRQIYLRPLLREDARISWQWRNDADVWRFTFNHPDKTVTQKMEEEWIDKVLNDAHRLNYAICLKNNDQYIGNVYLTDITDETAIFSIFIGEKTCWARGIGTEATRLILAHAFDNMHLKTVILEVKEKNIGGRCAYEKAGFMFKQQDGENILMIASNNG